MTRCESHTGKPIPLVHADLNDTEAITAALREHLVECVIHFAALAYVGESVTDPLRYYHNNTSGSRSLLQAMDDAGVRRLVFSSTCATYGEPPADRIPIREDTPQSPINPYGWSKLFVERILLDYAAAPQNSDFGFAALRYFNVAGSDPDGIIGEDHDPETHLIPVLLNTALGKREKITIFGDDYDTADGTCIRDYIHVADLVDAHIHVMQALQPGDGRFYNLGTGGGQERAGAAGSGPPCDGQGRFVPSEATAAPATPPQLYADPRKIEQELGWKASITDVDTMVADAWKWFRAHPDGYGD